jgi:hypothetical protein
MRPVKGFEGWKEVSYGPQMMVFLTSKLQQLLIPHSEAFSFERQFKGPVLGAALKTPYFYLPSTILIW